jgi:hypothetical protein
MSEKQLRSAGRDGMYTPIQRKAIKSIRDKSRRGSRGTGRQDRECHLEQNSGLDVTGAEISSLGSIDITNNDSREIQFAPKLI